MNIPERRRKLLRDLKRTKMQIAFVQETHFKTGHLPSLKNRDFPHSYHCTNPHSKTKGVSILLSKDIPWQLLDAWDSRDGRYLFVKGLVWNVKVPLKSFYCPNQFQDASSSRCLMPYTPFRRDTFI